jgi:ATP-binding protein involved in chromosome partitioning
VAQILPTVKHPVAIASNKGGVGKSTVAVNLAIAVSQTGTRVGLLDADVTGPNIPLMMGVKGSPRAEGNRIFPLEAHGIKVMSIGFLMDEMQPVVWRGPMIAHAIRQFVEQVEWGTLDYLFIDLPPGTSDASLSLAQLVALRGVVVVTTPSEAALADVIRGIGMFQKLNAPVLGVVENMSYYIHAPGAEPVYIFGQGGGRRTAEKMNVPLLGELPLDPAIRAANDSGRPITALSPGSPQAEAFRQLAREVMLRVEEQAARAPLGEIPLNIIQD